LPCLHLICVLFAGNLRLRSPTWASPWGNVQPACTAFGDLQSSQPWVLGANIAVGQYVVCEGWYMVTDTDLQQATLSPGGAIQVQLSVSVQSTVGQTLMPINTTAGALVQVLAEPGLALHMDATKCTVGELQPSVQENGIHTSRILPTPCSSARVAFACPWTPTNAVDVYLQAQTSLAVWSFRTPACSLWHPSQCLVQTTTAACLTWHPVTHASAACGHA
jgi:hypothetical protein